VLWKQESFVVLRPLHIEFFRNLLGVNATRWDFPLRRPSLRVRQGCLLMDATREKRVLAFRQRSHCSISLSPN